MNNVCILIVLESLEGIPVDEFILADGIAGDTSLNKLPLRLDMGLLKLKSLLFDQEVCILLEEDGLID